MAPAGKVVSNYDALVSDIAAKRQVVLTDSATAQNDANAFACPSTDPKGYLSLFRNDMKVVKSDLEAYRKSVHNLIDAVNEQAPED